MYTPWGTMLSRAVLVLGSVDLPAQSIVLNMKQHVFMCVNVFVLFFYDRKRE